MDASLNFDSFANTLVSGIKMTPPQRVGILVRVVGMTLEAKGLIAPVGSLCSVESQKHGDVYAEVIGFDDDVLYLMPFSEPVGVHPGSHVRLVSTTAQAEVGHAQLGRVLDGLGRVIDGELSDTQPDALDADPELTDDQETLEASDVAIEVDSSITDVEATPELAVEAVEDPDQDEALALEAEAEAEAEADAASEPSSDTTETDADESPPVDPDQKSDS